MDFSAIFAVNESPLELIARGTLMYWFLLLVFRFVLRRDPGALGVADILFVVIVADASQNAMAGTYGTVAEGIILVSTLVFWNYVLDWASYRWRAVHWLTEPDPVPLIKAGRVLHRNLRKEGLTLDDLDAQLRLAGIDKVASVRKAFMECDGKLSFLAYESKGATKKTEPDQGGIPGGG